MKKIKWSFIAIALIAICSAFATKKSASFGTVYGFDPILGWVAVEEFSDDYNCNPGEIACYYSEPNFDHPLTSEEFEFEYVGDK